MFRSYSYTIIRERINLCLLKIQLSKQSVKIHRCVFNTVVVWLHILGLYLCMYRGDDKSLARPGRKQANVSAKCLEFPSAPWLLGKKT